MKNNSFNLLHQEYQRSSEYLRTEYRELLTNEILSSPKLNPTKLADIFIDIANANINLAESAIEELKLIYYNDAATACQYSIKILKNDERKKVVYEQLDLIQSCIVKICVKNHNPLKPIKGQNDIDNLCHKEELQLLRNDTKDKLQKIETYKNTGQEEKYIKESAILFKNIAEAMESYLARLYKSAQDIIGQAPCKFAVIGLGSMALRQITPYSDLEFAIITENENYKQDDDLRVKNYFKNLSHLVHFMVINLGETIIPTSKYNLDLSMLINEAVNFDIGGKTPLGRVDQDKPYELIQTIEGMLDYLENNEQRSEHIDKNLPNILQKSCFIYGDRDLQKNYQHQAEEFLNEKLMGGRSNAEIRALKALLEGTEEKDYTKSSITSKKIEGTLKQFAFNVTESEGKLFDVKQEIYRLPDRLIYNLGLIYGVQGESSWDTLDKLCELGKIHFDGAKNLKLALTFATTLRLKVYEHYKQQKDTMDFSKSFSKNSTEAENFKEALSNTFSLDISDLEPDGALFNYYKIVLPLYQKLQDFCFIKSKGDRETFFVDEEFKSNSPRIMAAIHLRLLQYKDALNYYLQNYKELVEEDKPEPLFIAASKNILALIYNKLGNHELALDCQLNGLELYKSQLGSKHKDVAKNLYNIGGTYGYMGNHQKALETHQEAYELFKELLGEGDFEVEINIAHSLNSIGSAYGELGYYKKALKKHEKALGLYKKLLGTNHLEVATCLNSVGDAYSNLGEYKLALQYMRKALEIRENLLAPNHPRLATSLNNVGYAYKDLGDYKAALPYLERAFTIREEVFGHDHYTVATIIINIGLVLNDLERHEEALIYQLEALEIYERLQTKVHPNIAKILHNIGCIYNELGRGNEALQYHNKSLAMYKKLFDNNEHPEVATSIDSRGMAFETLKKYKQALNDHMNALKIREKLLNEHLEVAVSFNNVGANYVKIGQYHKALHYQLKALSSFIMSLDKKHPYIATSYKNLGHTYGLVGNYQKCLEFSMKALKLSDISQGNDHPTTIIFKENYSSWLVRSIKFKQAYQKFESAEQIKTCAFTWVNSKLIPQNEILKKFNQAEEELIQAKNLFNELQNTEYILKVLRLQEELYTKYARFFPKNGKKLKDIQKEISIHQNKFDLSNKLECEIESKIMGEDFFKDLQATNELVYKPENSLRLISYNITADYFDKKDNTEDIRHHWEFRSPYVIELLETLHPDIMCLQELSTTQAFELNAYFSGKGYSCVFLSQTPSEIEAGLIAYGEEVKVWCGKNIGTPLIGTFISNKCIMLEVNRFWLNEQPDALPEHKDRGETDKGFGNINTYRAVLWIKVQIENNKILFVFNSHYPLSGNNKARLECAKVEMHKIKEIAKDDNWISSGDRNIIPTDQDNDIYNPASVYEVLSNEGYDIKSSKKHYGINTTWLGFTYDEHKNLIQNGVFQDQVVLDIIVSNLAICKSFFLHGAFDPLKQELLPLLETLSDEQNTERYFASDHAIIGVDIIWD